MKDIVKLKELLLGKLKLVDIMLAYKVPFTYDPRLASEVQLKCPFHGKDNKPSARLYNTTNSFFCWVCRKSWDPISFVMDKEKMSYRETIKYLINRYGIDTSAIPDDPTIEVAPEKRVDRDGKNIEIQLVYQQLKGLSGKLPFEKYRALCSVYCALQFQDSKGKPVTETLKKLEDKIICLRS